MGRPTFSDEQIAIALRQHEVGTPVADVCRQIGASEPTFYVWKKKYANLGVSELRELRQLRDDNNRLKRLEADLTLDKQILSDVAKKALKPSTRRDLTAWIIATYQLSARLVRAMRAWYRPSTAIDQTALRRRLKEIALARPRSGCLRIHVMLRLEGWQVNHKRIHRLYRLDGLQLRMRVRRRKHMCLNCGVVP